MGKEHAKGTAGLVRLETVLWKRNMGKELMDWYGWIEEWIRKDE